MSDPLIKDGLETCPGCGSDIDPETCWCGIAIADHDHDPLMTQCPCIPMGCACYRSAAHEGHADDEL